jgi:hypothetical protein
MSVPRHDQRQNRCHRETEQGAATVIVGKMHFFSVAKDVSVAKRTILARTV